MIAIEYDLGQYMTQGMKANGNKEWTLKLTQKTCNQLLQVLESTAEKSTVYGEVQLVVLLATLIRQQLREQGY